MFGVMFNWLKKIIINKLKDFRDWVEKMRRRYIRKCRYIRLHYPGFFPKMWIGVWKRMTPEETAEFRFLLVGFVFVTIIIGIFF